MMGTILKNMRLYVIQRVTAREGRRRGEAPTGVGGNSSKRT